LTLDEYILTPHGCPKAVMPVEQEKSRNRFRHIPRLDRGACHGPWWI